MIRTYAVKIEGLTPLLMHWDNIQWADDLTAWRKDIKNTKSSKAGDDRTPAWSWIGSVYHDEETVCMAADNISRCLMEGGAMVPVPDAKGGKTFKSQTQSGMQIDGVHVPFMINGGKTITWKSIELLNNENSFSVHMEAAKKLGFELFVKRARIGQTKHIRVRPKFNKWSIELINHVSDEKITKPILESIYRCAGTYKGLCDWRPGSKTPGSYGMFELVSLKLV